MPQSSRKMDKNSSRVIDIDNKLSNLLETKEAQMKARERQSIYKLPTYVTHLKKNAYKPQAVSFGPYHYGDRHLEPNEAHKERALLHFLKKSGKHLTQYLSALGEVVQDLKGAYDSLEPVWEQDSEAFLQLMIRDGCFMLEILQASSADQHQQTMEDYANNDPIFSYHAKIHMIPYIQRDMLMLENQLPMLLLKTLFGVANPNPNAQRDKQDINKLILDFFGFRRDQAFGRFPERFGECLHVLDAYRKILLSLDPIHNPVTQSRSFPRIGNHIISVARRLLEAGIRIKKSGSHNPVTQSRSFPRGANHMIPDARSLQEAGIRIKKSGRERPMEIRFNRDSGILRLPQIKVDDTTETIYVNLIAFERFHAGAGHEVIDFCYFMDDIIDDAKDVNILETCGIIENAIGSDKAVAQLFNSLTKDVPVDAGSGLADVREEINKYCEQKLHKWRASLVGTYFRNPWAIISVIAGFALFGLAITQTIYTALQYYQH